MDDNWQRAQWSLAIHVLYITLPRADLLPDNGPKIVQFHVGNHHCHGGIPPTEHCPRDFAVISAAWTAAAAAPVQVRAILFGFGTEFSLQEHKPSDRTNINNNGSVQSTVLLAEIRMTTRVSDHLSQKHCHNDGWQPCLLELASLTKDESEAEPPC